MSPASVDLGVRLLSLQEEIQQRIAADLHDSTCQHLIAASLNVGRLRQGVHKSSGVNEICDDIDTSINHALREIRAFVYLLHPQHLRSDGLKTTIERYVGGFSSRTSLKCTLKIAPGVDRLSYKAQCSIFRVIQEALTNVFRHAKAKKIDITIEDRKTHFQLRVSDDGCGIPASRTRAEREAFSIGVGIPGMKIRVHQLGGSLEIQSMIGSHGTALCAEIPYPILQKRAPERLHRGIGDRGLRTINRGGPIGALGGL
jgi:two-component system sensor histidine kinase UhpB